MEETLGKRIVAHRKRLGLTQDQLAEQLGITAQAVSKWEHDLSCPDITMLPRLAAIFGTTTDELLGVEAKPVQQAELAVREEDDEPEGIHAQTGNWEFHWDGGRKPRVALAVLVLLVGSLLLAGRWLSWDVSFWGLLWPSALLVFGVTGLYPRFRFYRLACVFCGGWFLTDAMGLLPPALDSGVIFPAMLVLFGISLLAEALRKPGRPSFRITRGGSSRKAVNHCSVSDERFAIENCFGEDQRLIELPRLSYGTVECAFGALTLDLSGCAEIAPDCSIAIECAFSAVTLLVPRRFRIESAPETVFSRLDTEGTPDPGAQPIRLDCQVCFGTVTVCYI